MPCLPIKLTLAATLAASFFPSLALGQLVLSDRGCSPNDTFHPGNSSYHLRNATGSLQTPGFPNTNILDVTMPHAKPWTWYIGIQQLLSPDNYFRDVWQPIWVDTNGTDLSSEDLGFKLCYFAYAVQSQSQQKRGYKDDGDCTTLFSDECVKDWKTLLGTELPTNSTKSPCETYLNQTPASCRDYIGGEIFSDNIPASAAGQHAGARNCSFGQGDPDYDLVYASGAQPKSSVDITKDFSTYDKVLTSTVPLFVVAWNNSASSNFFPESQIMCLRADDFATGSRKVTSVPSAGKRLTLAYSTVLCLVCVFANLL